jgi:hypothetical protein
MIAQLIALHLGGVPELAMFLGPILLIIAFLKIARRNEATAGDDEEDWDADLGDLPEKVTEETARVSGPLLRQPRRS